MVGSILLARAAGKDAASDEILNAGRIAARKGWRAILIGSPPRFERERHSKMSLELCGHVLRVTRGLIV
jgi:hypothetical protein